MNNSSLPQITSSRSLIDIRRTMPHYKDIAQPIRMAWLHEQVIYCNALNHQTPEPQIVEADVAGLDTAIMQDAVVRDFTQPEISFSMFHGTMGEYGDYYGLTARTFMGFFREFTRTDVKYNATFEERKKAEPQKGSWALERIEHHRRQVQAEWELRNALDEGPAIIDKDKIRQTIIGAGKHG